MSSFPLNSPHNTPDQQQRDDNNVAETQLSMLAKLSQQACSNAELMKGYAQIGLRFDANSLMEVYSSAEKTR